MGTRITPIQPGTPTSIGDSTIHIVGGGTVPSSVPGDIVTIEDGQAKGVVVLVRRKTNRGGIRIEVNLGAVVTHNGKVL